MKSTAILLSIALAETLNAAPAATSNSGVAVKDIGNDHFELTLNTSTTVNIFEAQRELAPTAKRTRAEKEVHFGHYAFAINQPLSDPTSETTHPPHPSPASTPPPTMGPRKR
jgi:hypothetical protein